MPLRAGPPSEWLTPREVLRKKPAALSDGVAAFGEPYSRARRSYFKVPSLQRIMTRAPASLMLSRVRTVEAPASPAYASDAELVSGIRAGDAKSKEQLYRKHVDYIAGMSTRMLRSTDASEDVVQDAFVIAFDQLNSLRDPNALRGWLASIAVSQIRRRLGKLRLMKALGLDRSLDDASLDGLARADTSAETRSELAALDLVLQTLPTNQRIAWMLRFVEEEPLAEVAVACDCSLATAKRWIAAADVEVQKHVRVIMKEQSS